MANVASFAKQVCGVITLKDYTMPEYLDVADMLKNLLSNADYGNFAFIVHNEDFDANGCEESPHIHFFAECLTRKRVRTVIHEISKYCDVLPEAVTCSPCSSEVSTLQYFIHKNDPDKVQYDRSRIVHNYKDDALDIMLDSDVEGISPQQLYSIVMKNRGITSRIMNDLGVKAYMKFRWCILDLQRELFGIHVPLRYPKENDEKKAPN